MQMRTDIKPEDREAIYRSIPEEMMLEFREIETNFNSAGIVNPASLAKVMLSHCTMDDNGYMFIENKPIDNWIITFRANTPDAFNDYQPNKQNNAHFSRPYRANPWKKETFNLTEQGKILRENPELAEKFKAKEKKA